MRRALGGERGRQQAGGEGFGAGVGTEVDGAGLIKYGDGAGFVAGGNLQHPLDRLNIEHAHKGLGAGTLADADGAFAGTGGTPDGRPDGLGGSTRCRERLLAGVVDAQQIVDVGGEVGSCGGLANRAAVIEQEHDLKGLRAVDHRLQVALGNGGSDAGATKIPGRLLNQARGDAESRHRPRRRSRWRPFRFALGRQAHGVLEVETGEQAHGDNRDDGDREDAPENGPAKFDQRITHG